MIDNISADILCLYVN